MIVISYGAADGVYDVYLDRLRQSRTERGLAHDMEIIPANTRRGACLQKPSFIRSKLEQYRQPVVWLDAEVGIEELKQRLAAIQYQAESTIQRTSWQSRRHWLPRHRAGLAGA